jgi:hypothetical protein
MPKFHTGEPMQRRNLVILALALAIMASLVGGWWFGNQSSRNSKAHGPETALVPAGPDSSLENPPLSPIPAQPTATSDAEPPRASQVSPRGKSERIAYRIAVRNGTLSLDGTTRLTGDFHPRRATPAWMPGMWCMRLLDGNMRVLAEDTALAPDATCIVLDPKNPDAHGHPQVTQFSGLAEETMMQVLLPPHPNAQWLRVYRLDSSTPSAWTREPEGKLLASFQLP